MNTSRIPSPARSLGVISTPRKHTPRRSRSVCSAKSNVSVRLTKVISDSFKISPISNRRSVLNDDTDIEIPGRKSWWKKLGENSRDMIDLLDNKDIAEVNNVAEEFDVEILSQEKKNYSLDLPESSDGESINSIVIPQRKLFTQKENQVQKKFEHIIDNRETLAKLQKSHFDQEKDIDVGPKNLFNKASKPRTKPAFPAALLNISSKAVNKTKEMPAPEVEGQVRNLFGNRPGMKRKNLFADFIVSESEDEIPDIQPKVFGFQKNAQKRYESSASRGIGHSPTSSIDLELDDWKLLPSSTMVENQFEEATTPVKRAKLSKLSEAKESETMNTNSTVNKTRQSNKSATSKNKSKTSMSKLKDKKNEELLSASKTKEDLLKSKNNLSLNTSSNVRMTRNKSKSIESPLKVEEHTKLHNKSKNKSQSHLSTPMEVQEGDKNTENNEIIMKTGLNQQAAADAPEEDDEDFTLEYDNDDEQVNESLAADNIENKSNENINLIDEERNKTQSNKDELDDAHVEKQKDDNKQQYFKDFDKQNKSADQVKEINRSQSKGKQKQSLSDSQKNNSWINLDEVHQKTKNESRIEKDKMDTDEKNVTNDIENTDEGENVNESTQHNESTQRNDSTKTNDETDETDEENEQQNESQQLGDENEEQRESTHSNDDNEIRNKSKESEAEIKEQNESTHLDHEHEQQNESSQSNNDIQNESIRSDVENEIEQDNHEDVDETIIEAEEEETENEQDESENEQKTEEQVQQDESEAEQETEEHIPQNESENINSDNQEQSDSKSNHSETEEQENEAMEIEHEEEYESDLEEQNETENEESETENQESENYDSDDNLQNESNLSKNDEQEEQVESDQVQNEDVREENEVIETFNHDATLRNKKKDPTIVKSPEVILHDKTNQMESFTTEGRNTSIRKTKSVIKNLNIKPSLAPVRESTGFSDGTRDSSAEGSGWDSHRTTRKTIRLTLGKDFTPRKSLRALVMEKSAKRHTNINEVTTKIPQANSTELPAFDSYEDAAEMNEVVEEPSDHEISARTRQTTLENYLQKIKQENLEKKRKMEEEIRASLKAPTRDIFNPFKVPLKPVRRIKPVQNKPRPKQTKPSTIPLNMLPSEVLEDMKYKPPKRFQPSNASWITKRLYKFLENKLEPKYDYKARIRAERLVELLYGFTREVKRGPSDQAVDTLKKEMARLEIVKTHFDFYEFFHKFMPREIRVKVVPDIVNKISLPRGGVFSEILQ